MQKALLALFTLFTATLSIAKTHNVYFGTGGNPAKGIYHAKFDTNKGTLSAPSLAAEIRSPGFLAMDADKSHLYAVGVLEEPCVAAYKIENDGSLVFLNSEAIGDKNGAHISVHPSGKFLLTAQYGGGSTAVFPILKNGSVGKRSQLIEHEGGSGVVGTRQNSPHPHWTGYSPDGNYAFVPDLGLDQIVSYKINHKNGTLKPNGYLQALPGAGPRHMRFSLDGRFIYLLNELRLSVTTFEYNAQTGLGKQLTTTQALSDAVKAKEKFNSSAEILVHPNGEFVYSSNRGHDSVTAYRANPKTGKLSVSEVESIRGSFPRNINLDPTSNWLLAAGQHSNTISVFAIDPESGEITFQTKNVTNVPSCICILFGN